LSGGADPCSSPRRAGLPCSRRVDRHLCMRASCGTSRRRARLCYARPRSFQPPGAALQVRGLGALFFANWSSGAAGGGVSSPAPRCAALAAGVGRGESLRGGGGPGGGAVLGAGGTMLGCISAWGEVHLSSCAEGGIGLVLAKRSVKSDGSVVGWDGGGETDAGSARACRGYAPPPAAALACRRLHSVRARHFTGRAAATSQGSRGGSTLSSSCASLGSSASSVSR
jgi:hypothetical protein